MRESTRSRGSWRGTVGLIAGILALGLVGLGARALPAAVGVDRLTSLVAEPAPATASPAAAASPTPARTPAVEPAEAEPSEVPPISDPAEGTLKAHRVVEVPATGPGSYDRAGLDVDAATTTGRLIRYDVQIEKNLDLEPDKAAQLIEEVLNDKRSWRGSGQWRFELVSSASEANLHAYIVTPGTTDQLCAPLLTRGEVSCQNGNRVVLNAKRWFHGAESFGTDLAGYRRYLINHEFGHALGHQHLGCPGAGQLAPVMMQQTKGLGGCKKNPWPLADGD